MVSFTLTSLAILWLPLATTIGGVTVNNKIFEMCQEYYKMIINSLKNNSKQEYVTDKISLIKGQSIIFSSSDINDALDSLIS